MDYRALLKKYISFIVSEEGIDYIPRFKGDCHSSWEIEWTDEELKELQRLSAENENG